MAKSKQRQQVAVQEQRTSGFTPILAALLLCGIVILAALWATRAANPVSPGSSSSNNSRPAAPAATNVSVARIGETVTVGDWEVTIEKAESAQEIEWSGFGNKEAAKGKFILIYANVKNTTNKTSSVNSFDYQLHDYQGAIYKTWTEFAYFSYAGQLNMSKFSEDIPPRSSTKLLAMFDVAEDANELILGIEAEEGIYLGSP